MLKSSQPSSSSSPTSDISVEGMCVHIQINNVVMIVIINFFAILDLCASTSSSKALNKVATAADNLHVLGKYNHFLLFYYHDFL